MGNPTWGKPTQGVNCYMTAEYTADPVTCYAGHCTDGMTSTLPVQTASCFEVSMSALQPYTTEDQANFTIQQVTTSFVHSGDWNKMTCNKEFNDYHYQKWFLWLAILFRNQNVHQTGYNNMFDMIITCWTDQKPIVNNLFNNLKLSRSYCLHFTWHINILDNKYTFIHVMLHGQHTSSLNTLLSYYWLTYGKAFLHI